VTPSPAVVLFLAASVQPQALTWPTVAPEHLDVAVQARSLRIPLVFSIKSRDGKPLYRLTCGSYDSVIADFAFSGDFECQLQTVPARYDQSSSLFAEADHETADWQTRARFLVPDLTGRCADIPDFGRIRTFRLRAMRLTLAISDIALEQRGGRLALKSFRFGLTVASEPGVESRTALPAKAVEQARTQGCEVYTGGRR
jgi:hypothetical protein